MTGQRKSPGGQGQGRSEGTTGGSASSHILDRQGRPVNGGTLQFLRALFPDLGSSVAECRLKATGTGTWRSSFHADLRMLARSATTLAPSHDVYVGVASRRDTTDGTKANLAWTGAVFAELDVGEGKPYATLTAAYEAVRRLPLRPSMVIESGRGLHLYWLLKEPWPLDNADDLAAFEAVTNGLAIALKADAGTWDASRVLRLPGTFWHKEQPPRMVNLTESNDLRYCLSDFEEWAAKPTYAESVAFGPDADGQEAMRKAEINGLPARSWRLITEGHPDSADRSRGDFAVCCDLLRAGLTDDEIRAIFRAYAIGEKYAERGNADRYLALTIGKALAAITQPEEGRPPSFHRTDSGNGELFAHLYGDRLRYDHRRKRWLLWLGHWWMPDADAEVRRLAKLTARRRYRDAGGIDNLKEREAEARWAISSESHMRLDASLSLAQAEHPIADAGHDWDSNPWLLGAANGVIDLRTGTLHDGRPEDRLTMHSPTAYNPDAPCPRWLAFLDRVMAGNEALIDFLQRAVGYSLTGNVSEQVRKVASRS